ncbi:MAG: glycoside hydrolase family 9 protein [Lachnospiraceae bacterium]|nr:glycoside hydrolase family 9 protein [Lachnospiraceae bacterium]
MEEELKEETIESKETSEAVEEKAEELKEEPEEKTEEAKEESEETKEDSKEEPEKKAEETKENKEKSTKKSRNISTEDTGEKIKSLAIPVFVGALIIALLTIGVIIIKKNFFNKNSGSSEITGSEVSGSEIPGVSPSGTITPSYGNDTGDFSLYATEYEGREGTGEYNYGEALQKALLFYELQRSGDLPEKTRCNWRGDSALDDGSDNGIDLTGGLYDAGDHVKFNLPMAYTASVLAWSIYENKDAYTESGQLEYALGNVKWIDDYLIKCHPEKEVFYYQVGNGGIDHSWWGPAEVMSMDRPSYKVDATNPGSTVAAEAAAALAAGSVIFADEDQAYSEECLKHAKELYEYAAKYQSDAGYKEAAGFYDSHSGFNDELSFAAAWLYLATKEDSYKKAAKDWFSKTNGDYKWTLCWDDVALGTALIMGRETKDSAYLTFLENNLDYWTDGVNGERITYTPKGLAWLDAWGSLRYASSASFLAITYANSDICPKDKQKKYHDFAVAQIGYCLGSTGFSFEIGFGDSYPQHPHHRTSQGSPSNNMNDPSTARHTLCGALVGGPDANDSYADDVSNYVNNEVADDYNAGFVGALAALYQEYGGKTLVNYGAVEKITEDEITVQGGINVSGDDFIEVKAIVRNQTAWPARALTNATLCYFVDLSEVYEAGGSISDVTVNMNYSQGGNASELVAWDEENHIYYLPISFAGTRIAPGSQDECKKEVQFRMTCSKGWDNSNDFSYQDLEGSNGGSLNDLIHMALYEGEELLYGSLPDGSGVAPTGGEKPVSDPKKEESKPISTEVSGGDLKLEIQNQSTSGSGSTLAFTVKLKNDGKADIELSSIDISYFFSDPDTSKLVFYCDYASIEGEKYQAITDSIKGDFSKTGASDKTASVKLVIGIKDSKVLPAGHTLNVQVRVARSDWSNMDFGDDYSAAGPQYMTVEQGGKILLGTEPK